MINPPYSTRIKSQSDILNKQVKVNNGKELDQYFDGVMIEIYDWDIGYHSVPGWKCKACGWQVGSIGLPPAHNCPIDGQAQSLTSPARSDQL